MLGDSRNFRSHEAPKCMSPEEALQQLCRETLDNLHELYMHRPRLMQQNQVPENKQQLAFTLDERQNSERAATELLHQVHDGVGGIFRDNDDTDTINPQTKKAGFFIRDHVTVELWRSVQSGRDFEDYCIVQRLESPDTTAQQLFVQWKDAFEGAHLSAAATLERVAENIAKNKNL